MLSKANRKCAFIPVSCENGDPGSPYSWEYRDPGPHFPGSMGTRDPHISGKMGTPFEKWGPPVWQTIFWKFRDPQCDAGLSTSITINNMLKQVEF